ncbi:MAG: diguanylate cyclase [Pseudomonadales bacterium]|jgi:diguanylate cyclase|nr:diguanylate cyclase [Gammaproteobacteria bacterium]MBP6052204.1 diguanylate cyclase [Pseudomonadales bacterium]MBK6582266.1 diguanylate cyclase [Gammaproteobacteria bacterium]MBK7521461.1 diguanylate cyclase [Gammaproteobacteria bacterium]MBK8307726.1 diguanylate cyclase [Gammaproteobacteria bacterium]
MAESIEQWKQRYLSAQAQAEREACEHRDMSQQLVRAVVRVTLACDGMDPALDAEFDGLRKLLRLGKSVSASVLASKIDVIEDCLREVDKKVPAAANGVADELDELAGHLRSTNPPRDLARRIDAFRRQVRERAQEPAALAQLLQAYLCLQADAVLAIRQAETPQRGLLSRLFNSAAVTEQNPAPAAPAPQPAPAATACAATQAESPPSEAPVGDDFAPLRNPVGKALDALIEIVRVPENDAYRAVYDGAKMRVARGVHSRDLVRSIDDIRVLTGAALARNQDEFEQFLQQLNERLEDTGTAIDGTHALIARDQQNKSTLDKTLRDNLEGLREQVAEATEIAELKLRITSRVQLMGSALDDFQAREAQLRLEFEQQTAAMRVRIQELDERSREAETRIVEQRRLALTDSLTQLPNREAYARRLVEEFERWRRYARPVSLALCDVDHFKKVNDRHGHAVGDTVLRDVATTLRNHLRETDFLARYGGEEFVILLAETDSAQAHAALDKARQAIADNVIECAGGKLSVTSSFGVAQFGEGDDPERVFTRADAALYRAKNGGRNQVRVYDPGADGSADVDG